MKSGNISGKYSDITNIKQIPPKSDLFMFERKPIINNDNNMKIIEIPKLFSSTALNNLINSRGFQVEFHNPNDVPLVIKDLKRIINSRKFSKEINLEEAIENYNYVIAKKIYDINNNIKKKRNKSIDEQLFLHDLMSKV